MPDLLLIYAESIAALLWWALAFEGVKFFLPVPF